MGQDACLNEGYVKDVSHSRLSLMKRKTNFGIKIKKDNGQ